MVAWLKYAAVFLCLSSGLAHADLIPPHVQAARDRLKANPKVFDRYDTFCSGKQAGDECLVPGNTFAGGGKGICRNDIGNDSSTIDLTCVRTGSVEIVRKLPNGGFVDDDDLCRRRENAAAGNGPKEDLRWNCVAMQPPPADRFCEGKAIDSQCTVELVFQGNVEQHPGVCRKVTETNRYYFQGRRIAKRDVIQCEPEQPVTRQYAPATWWQKLRQ